MTSPDITGDALRALKPSDLLAAGLTSANAADDSGLRDELFTEGALALATQCHDTGVPIDALHLCAVVLHRVTEQPTYAEAERATLNRNLAVQAYDLPALQQWTTALVPLLDSPAQVRAALRLFEKASSLYALRQAIRQP